MEAIGLFTFLVMCIIGLVLFLAIMKIFSISHDISVLKNTVKDFTKYYYELQRFRMAQENPKENKVALSPAKEKIYDPAILDKPIDEKLSLTDYEIIFEKDHDRFMTIANYFYKHDIAHYNQVILPVIERNK